MTTSKSDEHAPVATAQKWPPKSVLHPADGHLWIPRVAFDFHEVVVSFLRQFALVANQLYPGANVNPATAEFYHPGFDPEVAMSPQEFERAFYAFAALSQGGYGDLPAIAGVKEQMQQIRAAGIGIQILTYVPGANDLTITDRLPVNTGVAQRVTLDLIEKLGLPVDLQRDIEFIAPHQKPYYCARKHIPLLVEDNEVTAAGMAQIAHAALLVPAPYNKGFRCKNVLRLRSHREIASRVIEFYAALREHGLVLERGK